MLPLYRSFLWLRLFCFKYWWNYRLVYLWSLRLFLKDCSVRIWLLHILWKPVDILWWTNWFVLLLLPLRSYLSNDDFIFLCRLFLFHFFGNWSIQQNCCRLKLPLSRLVTNEFLGNGALGYLIVVNGMQIFILISISLALFFEYFLIIVFLIFF